MSRVSARQSRGSPSRRPGPCARPGVRVRSVRQLGPVAPGGSLRPAAPQPATHSDRRARPTTEELSAASNRSALGLIGPDLLEIAVEPRPDTVILRFAIAARTTEVQEDLDDSIIELEVFLGGDPNNTRRSPPSFMSVSRTRRGSGAPTLCSTSRSPRRSNCDPQVLTISPLKRATCTAAIRCRSRGWDSVL